MKSRFGTSSHPVAVFATALVAFGGLSLSARLSHAQDDAGWIDLKGDLKSVDSLDFSPDGTRLVVMSSRGDQYEVRVWDIAAGTSRVLIERHAQLLVKFLDDGKTVVAGTKSISIDQPAEAAVWDLETGQPGAKMPGGLQIIAPGGTAVLYVPVDGKWYYHVWDVKSGKLALAIPYTDGHKFAITSDGKTVALWGKKTVRLFDVPSGKERAGIEGLRANLDDMAFSPDGKRLACVEDNGGPSLWDISDTAARPRILNRNTEMKGDRGSFSVDGKTLVIYQPSRSQHLVDATTLKLRATVTASYGAVFTKAGTLVAPATQGSQFVVADIEGKTLDVVDTGAEMDVFAVSPDGALLAGGLKDGTVRVLRLPVPGRAVASSPGSELKKITDLPHPQLVRNTSLFEDKPGEGYLAFSADGKYLAGSAQYATGYFGAWEVSTGKLTASGGYRLTAWSFMPDGKTLFAQEKDDRGNGLEVIYDLTTGRKKVVNTIRRSGAIARFRFNLLAAAPDGKFLAVVPNPKRSQLMLLPGGDARRAEMLFDGGADRIAFSPDGKLLAAAVSNQVKLFELTKKTEMPTNVANANNYLAFANDGRAIATVDDKPAAYVYEVSSGQLVKEIDLKRGHSARVYGAAFSPASPLFVSYDADGAVLLKNWETGKQLARIAAHSTAVVAAAFSPDGKTLATATHGTGAGTVRLWSLGDAK